LHVQRLLILALLFSCGSVHATEEECGVLVNGELVKVSSLKIGSLADNAILQPLQADPSKMVEAVVCFRDTLIPERNDYKVVVGGVPFAIKSGDRVLWLEVKDGQLRFNFEDSALSGEEMEAVQLWLNEAQERFVADASAIGAEG